MNKDFRLARLRENKIGAKPYVIDFTDYSKPAKEPVKTTRRWSLLGDINQKKTRPQDKPRLLSEMTAESANKIRKRYPQLFE